jgi:hypothetical protein
VFALRPVPSPASPRSNQGANGLLTSCPFKALLAIRTIGAIVYRVPGELVRCQGSTQCHIVTPKQKTTIRQPQVISVADNDAAKHALASIQNVDVFIVGHAASEQTRIEMVGWLKANFPRIKIVALIPPGNRQLESVDCSVVLNNWNEWLLLLEAAAG